MYRKPMTEIAVKYRKNKESWAVTEDGTIVEEHRLKQDAEKSGRNYAKQNRPSRFLVYNLRGELSYSQYYEWD